MKRAIHRGPLIILQGGRYGCINFDRSKSEIDHCCLHVLNPGVVGYFGIGGAQIIDGQLVNIIIAGQSGKIFDLFSGDP